MPPKVEVKDLKVITYEEIGPCVADGKVLRQRILDKIPYALEIQFPQEYWQKAATRPGTKVLFLFQLVGAKHLSLQPYKWYYYIDGKLYRRITWKDLGYPRKQMGVLAKKNKKVIHFVELASSIPTELFKEKLAEAAEKI